MQPAKDFIPSNSPEQEAVFAVLSATSPNDRYKLVFDWYQAIEESPGSIDIGGEPDSAPLLIDLRLGISNRFEFCGTPCGYDWGCWIDSTRFALAGWSDEEIAGLASQLERLREDFAAVASTPMGQEHAA